MKEAAIILASKVQIETVLELADKNIKKRIKRQTFDLSYFVDKNFFGGNASQNYLVFQPPFSLLQYLLVVI